MNVLIPYTDALHRMCNDLDKSMDRVVTAADSRQLARLAAELGKMHATATALAQMAEVTIGVVETL
jgi:hypothetical protein